MCSRSPIWDLWRSHSKFVIILVKKQLQSSSNYDHPTMTNTCQGTNWFMPFIFSNFISTPFLPVFCVGSFWPCLLQWYYSDWSSTLQHSSGSVQPPSHSSCPLHLCCASHRSVLVQWATAAAHRWLVECILYFYYPLIPCCFTGNSWKSTLLTQLWQGLSVLLFKVTLQELCGLELRKEGSGSWISSLRQ